MAASEEDLTCLTAICSSIASSLESLPMNRATERDLIDMFDLIPQVIAADLHPARIQALLDVSPSPIEALCMCTEQRLGIGPELHIFALKTISQVVGICCASESGPFISRSIKLDPLALVLRCATSLLVSSATNEERTAAAELLFVIVMKIPAFREHFVNANTLPLLATCVFETHCDEERDYLTALLRVFADENSDDLVKDNEPKFFEMCLDCIFRSSKTSVVLLLETLTLLVTNKPHCYIHFLAGGDSKIMDRAISHLWHQDDNEVSFAMDSLLRAILRTESLLSISDPPPRMLAIFSSEECWTKATDVHIPYMPRLLTMQRDVVLSSHTRVMMFAMEREFVKRFPVLCAIISGERTPREQVADATIIASAMCAKLPSVRSKVRQMIHGYEEWGAQLLNVILTAFHHFIVPTNILRTAVLVDCTHSVLNDGFQARNIDDLNVSRIVDALHTEQERRERANVCDSLDTAVLREFYSSAVPRDVQCLCQSLCEAMLMRAVATALGSTSPLNFSQEIVPCNTPRRASVKRGSKRSGEMSMTPRRQTGGSPYRAPSGVRSSLRAGISPITQKTRLGSLPAGGSSAAAEEYLMMAITMHLAVTFGIHYNRQQRGTIRRIEAPSGSFVQPVHRNCSQSWSARDVNNGELYVLFLPFHKVSIERINEEIIIVGRHLQSCKKMLVVTPSQSRSRRWFLHDMLNYILPKTELLLRDFLELVEKYSAADVIYQLGIVRLVDEGEREKDGAFAVAASQVDVAMPNEILRLSSGKFKDILHSGNISYVVRRLRQHYSESNDRQLEAVFDSLGFPTSADEQTGVPSQLRDIDRQIQKLEHQVANDTWNTSAEIADDVEPEYEANMRSPDDYVHSRGAGGTETETLPRHLIDRIRAAEELEDSSHAPPSLINFDEMYRAAEAAIKE